MTTHPCSTGDPEDPRPSRRPSSVQQPTRRPSPAGLLLPGTLLAGLLLTGCGGGPADSEREAPVPTVEAVPARTGTLPLEERLSGVVKARNQVAVQPEISARVVEVLVESGEAVRRGQPLVRLQDEELREQLRQAEAALRLAQAEAQEAVARVSEIEARVTRTRALAEEDLVSQMQLETQEAQLEAVEASAARTRALVEQAEATVEERRAALAKAVVRSPVAGRVGQRNAEVGQRVDPETLLFLVGDLDRVRVEIPLTEGMLSYIEEGLPVRITTEAQQSPNTLIAETAGGAPAGPIRASLSRISPFLEESSFSTLGEIDVDNRDGRLRPGMFVTVDVLYGESQRATLVPASALWKDPRTGTQGIFVALEMEGVEPAPPPAGEGGETVPAGSPQVAAPGVATPRVGPPGTPETGEPRAVPEQIHPLELRPVEVLAEGRGALGVQGLEAGEWVVTLGQQLLSGQESPTARVRPVSWERVFELQGLQREDLVQGFLERQRRAARQRGAEIPGIEEYRSAADAPVRQQRGDPAQGDAGGPEPAPGEQAGAGLPPTEAPTDSGDGSGTDQRSQ